MPIVSAAKAAGTATHCIVRRCCLIVYRPLPARISGRSCRIGARRTTQRAGGLGVRIVTPRRGLKARQLVQRRLQVEEPAEVDHPSVRRIIAGHPTYDLDLLLDPLGDEL